MLTIGPWWLFDTIIVMIVFFIMATTIRNGLWVGLYFTLFSLFIYLILTFIPQLISNAMAPIFISLLKKSRLIAPIANSFDKLDNTLTNSLMQIFKDFNRDFGKLSVGSFKDDVLEAMTAMVLYLIVFLSLGALLLVAMFIVYGVIHRRLKVAKMNRYVSSTLGGFLGAIISIIFASAIAMFFSIPIFDYSSQKFGVPRITETNNNSAADRVREYIDDGNQYSNYALSGQFNKLVPPGTLTFSYSTSCSFKYVVAPLMTSTLLLNSDENKNLDATQVIANVLGRYSDMAIEGYSTNNVLKLPVRQCLGVLPKESQNIVRMITELLMSASHMAVLGNEDEINSPNRGQAKIVFEQMDKYKENILNLKPKTQDFEKYRFTEKDFVDFFNKSDSIKDAPMGNQFIKAINYQKDDANGLTNKAIEEVFSNPHKLYTFMKNVYDANYYIASSSSFPPLPSVLTSLYLLPGLELVPSGMLAPLFGESYSSDGERWDLNFELRKYMGYINEN